MRKNLWRSVLVVPLLMSGLAFTASGHGQEKTSANIVFGTATEGRAYWQLAKRLEAVAISEGLKVKVLATQGSVENLERLADPEDAMNIALTQADVLQHYLGDHPGLSSKVEILEPIGLECVFVVASTNGHIANEKDWQSAVTPRIAIQAEGSGSAKTHSFMGRLVPELADDVVVYMNTADAINALYAEGEDRVDLVFVVYRPKYNSPEVRAALEQPDRFRLLPIEDSRLQSKLPTGQDVYEFLDIPLERQMSGGLRTVRTVCTRGLLLTDPNKIDPLARRKLQKVIEYHWGQIYPELDTRL